MKIIAASYLYNPGTPPIEGGAVVVSDGRIVATGTCSDLRSEYQCTLEEYPGGVMMPGMVNAHTHLELTHFPSWKLRKGLDYAPREYVDWIVQLVKLRRGATREELLHSVTEGFRLSTEAGTTAVGEVLTDLSLLPEYRRLGAGGRIFLEAIGHDPQICNERSAEIESALARFEGERLLPGISPHTPHTVAGEFMVRMAALAGNRGIPVMMHLAESSEEIDFWFDTSGRIASELYPMAGWEQYLPPPHRMSPVAYLDSLGVLSPMTTCIHCVHLTPADVEILRDRAVAVVLCLRSNDRLTVGIPPLMLFKGSRIPLAIGTDSLASNDSLSLWDEIRFIAEKFPRLFSPEELLVMATSGGARALHLQDRTGSLEPGKLADIQILNTSTAVSKERLPSMLLDTGRVAAVYQAGELYPH